MKVTMVSNQGSSGPLETQTWAKSFFKSLDLAQILPILWAAR